MIRFKDYSIRKKMISIILGITAIMLFLGFSIIGYFSIKMIIDVKISEAESLSNIIGEYSIAALAFNYPERGNEILSKLQNDPNVIACYIYESNGKPFSSYITGFDSKKNFPELDMKSNFSFFKGKNYHLSKKIYYDNNFYGWIYLIINTDVYATIRLAAGLFLIGFFVLLILGYFLANKLQNVISNPILKLTETTNKISASGEYSIRIDKLANDEIGLLYNEFNKLLDVIQKREEEKNLAQKEVKDREQWVNTIINSLNDAVFVHDSNTGQIIFINDTASKLYGYEKEEFINLSVGDISLNDANFNQEKVLEIMAECKSEGLQIFEWLAKKKDGTLFWAEINMREATLSGIDRILVVVRNIDERKKHQKEMNSLQNYLQDIVDSMPSIIIATDFKTRITQWNREAYEFTNLSPAVVMGKKLQNFDTGFPELENYIKNSMKNLEIIKLEKIEILKNEKRFFFNITIYPLSSTNTSGVVIRLDEVTNRIQMEELMIQSEKMMSVGGLAAGMAHEINNPLAGMMQNAIVVLNRITKNSPKNKTIAKECGITFESVHEYMEKRNIVKQLRLIHDSGIRASTIITNMLSFARKSEDKLQFEDLTQIMDMAIDLAQNDYDLKKKFDFRKVSIIKNYQENMDKCLCDNSKLEQVLLNLLKNGAHAMNDFSERESVFTIGLRQTESEFVIEIEDNGAGIPDSIKKRIFEPFFTTKEVGDGTGLGLSVSYFIITENHKGQMYVESKEGTGTKFIIKLPRMIQ